MRASSYPPSQLQKIHCAILLPVWLNKVLLILLYEFTYQEFRQLQIAQRLPKPKTESMPRLCQVLRGIQLDHSKHGKPTQLRLSITLAILKQLKQIWIKDNNRIPFNNIMLWVACLTTFFSICRSGEITIEREDLYDPSCHLSYSDLAVDNPSNPSIISMLIKKSKTGQGRKGAKVSPGKTGDTLYSVAALEAYLSVRGSNPGPLFQWESRVPLSKASFVKHVKTALIQAGLPTKNYSGPSFRIGAATTAVVAGLEDSTIQTRLLGKLSLQTVHQIGPSVSGFIVTYSRSMQVLVDQFCYCMLCCSLIS